MRAETIFEYRDYKKYLTDRMAGRPRGERSRLAAALSCHAAYVSLVLGGSSHFSLEQAERINEYLGHSEEEGHFLLLLVQHERAGSITLKRYFAKQLHSVIENRFVLQNRLKYKKKLSPEDQSTYYSAWYYAAIHIMLGVPGLQTPAAIGRYLRLPRETVNQVLRFLASVGLAEEKDGRYRTGAVSIHLGGESTNISRAHANWRWRTLQSLERPSPEDFHYSSVVSIAAKDVEAIKTIMVRAIEEIRAQVQGSGDEDVFCYSLDFFSLKDSV